MFRQKMARTLVQKLTWIAFGSASLGGAVITATMLADVRLKQMRIPPFLVHRDDGLVSVQHVYTKGGHTVLLIPMVHVAERAFYDSILRECYKSRAMILEESVVPPEALENYRVQEALDNEGEVTIPSMLPGFDLHLQKTTKPFRQVYGVHLLAVVLCGVVWRGVAWRGVV